MKQTLTRYSMDYKGLPFEESTGDWVAYSDTIQEPEVVAWQFFNPTDQKWHTGSNENNHRQNTLDAGFFIRDLTPTQYYGKAELIGSTASNITSFSKST